MNFTIRSTDCPAGAYRARFNGVEEMSHPEFGPGLIFSFEVCDGPHKGRRASRVTGADPTPRNAAGRMLSDLAGVAPANGVSVNPDELIGKEYIIVVRENDTGRTRVDSVCAVEETVPF